MNYDKRILEGTKTISILPHSRSHDIHGCWIDIGCYLRSASLFLFSLKEYDDLDLMIIHIVAA